MSNRRKAVLDDLSKTAFVCDITDPHSNDFLVKRDLRKMKETARHNFAASTRHSAGIRFADNSDKG